MTGLNPNRDPTDDGLVGTAVPPSSRWRTVAIFAFGAALGAIPATLAVSGAAVALDLIGVKVGNAGAVICGAAAVALTAAVGVVFVAADRKVRVGEHRRRNRACAHCGYSLRQLPATLRQCPECGHGFRPPEPTGAARRPPPGYPSPPVWPARPLTIPSAGRKRVWMLDRADSIDAFLAATAAKQPTPGGGSVAALVGALSAAIGEMVLNYSVGRKDSAAVDPQLKHVAAELAKAREVLLRLMVDDQAAYAELTAVRKLPAGSAERADRLPAVVLACVRGPQAVAATAVAVLGLCEQVVDHVNPWLLSDLAVCADLATATVRAAGYNVRVNLPSVDVAAAQQALAAETDQLWAHALERVQRVSPRIWARDAAVRSKG